MWNKKGVSDRKSLQKRYKNYRLGVSQHSIRTAKITQGIEESWLNGHSTVFTIDIVKDYLN